MYAAGFPSCRRGKCWQGQATHLPPPRPLRPRPCLLLALGCLFSLLEWLVSVLSWDGLL